MKKPKSADLSSRPQTEAEWQAWMNYDMDYAVWCLVSQGEFRPLFVMHTSDGEMMLFPASWKNQQSKENIQTLVRLVCVAYDVVAVGLSIEGWMRKVFRQSGESTLAHRTRANAIAPAEAEDRVEVLIVTMTYRDDAGECRSLGQIAEILRDAEGQPTGVKRDLTEKPGVEGRLVDLLPERSASPQIQLAARQLLEDIGVTLERVDRTS